MNNSIELIRKISDSLIKHKIFIVIEQIKARNDKRWKLYQLINNKEILNEKSICHKLYGLSKCKAYSQLKLNLKNELLNGFTILNTVTSIRSNSLQAKRKCLHYYNIGYTMWSNRIQEEAIFYIKKALKIAYQYELFNEAINCLSILTISSNRYVSFKEYEKYTNELFESHTYLGHILQATSIRNTLFKNASNKGYNKKFVEDASKQVTTLKKLYQKSNLSTIGSIYYQIRINVALHTNDLANATIYCNKYQKLIYKSPALDSIPNKGGINLLLANNYLRLHYYSRSIEAAKEAMYIYIDPSSNYIRACEALFFPLFYNNDYEKANDLISRIKTSPILKKNKFIKEKWEYFYINILFRQKKYQEVLDRIHDLTILSTDKEGWLAHIKVLEIICYIEKENYKTIFYKVEGYRAWLYRHKINKNLRLMKIYRALHLVDKSIYNPSSERRKLNYINTQLHTTDGKLKWEMSEAEVSPFHIWLNSYLERKEILS